MKTSSSFPSFWRAPIGFSTPSSRSIQMPGSADQESHVGGNEIQHSLANGLTEHRTHQYVNRPDGEMDMMIGFFLMNGFCVSFFLLFGLCVIFSCLRKRPSYFRRKQFSDTEPVIQLQDDSLKPKLKSIVSQVIKTNRVTTKITKSEPNSDVEQGGNDTNLRNPNSPNFSRSPSPSLRKTSLTPICHATFENSRRCSTSVSQENSAMIRHNLLGPLSFDDLHYM